MQVVVMVWHENQVKYVLTASDSKDAGLWRVDDGRERLHAKHAQVGNSECAALRQLRSSKSPDVSARSADRVLKDAKTVLILVP